MKFYALSIPGLEKLSQNEIKDLLFVSAEIDSLALRFSLEGKKEISDFISHSQSIRRIVLEISECSNLDSLSFDKIEFPWKEFFSDSLSFKVGVEGVKGQDNRLVIAKKVVGELISVLEKNDIKPEIELKKPDFLVNVFFTNNTYLIGIDLAGDELNSREYRVFPHSASFKGDLAYYFVRRSGFVSGNKLLSGFCKDGVLSIEAAFFSEKKEWNSLSKLSLSKFSFFKDTLNNSFDNDKDNQDSTQEPKIMAFDESSQNIIAARKNAKLGKVSNKINFHKYSLEELDLKFEKEMFDNLIFQITTKDESKINEIYYQASYILKKGGKMLIIGRKNWELSISDKFNLISKEDFIHGQSTITSWLLEKK